MAYSRRNPWYWFETVRAPAANANAPAHQYNALIPVNLHNELDRIFSGFFPGMASALGEAGKTGGEFAPRLEFSGDEKSYVISAELPGVDPGDISLEVRDNTLIIQGEKKSEHTEQDRKDGYYRTERTYGSFRRVIELPDDADEESINASNKDGVLKISIPRRKKSAAESRKIEIS